MTSWLIFWAPDLFMLFSLLVLLVYGIIVNSNLQEQNTVLFSYNFTKDRKYSKQNQTAIVDNPIHTQLHMNSLFVLWCLCAAYLCL